jgi:hypothetical protein
MKSRGVEMRFLVIKGRVLTPGGGDLKYNIFDVVDFDPTKNLENQKRKYVWRAFYDIDCKRLNKIMENVAPRQRNIILNNGKVIETITIFDDHVSGQYYGFIPVESFYNAELV